MSPRTRRWLVVSLGVVMLLFAGRWLASFLAMRWWAEAISPEALATATRWQLLGLGLDVGAVLIASAWFIVQGLLVARAIGSVQVEHRYGDAVVREVVPTRLLVMGAVVVGLVLGLLTGAGARNWRAPYALARETIVLGVDDPLLGVDVGDLISRVPLWRHLLGYWLTLVVLGLVLAVALYLAIGGIRRGPERPEIHPDARRHVGGLLAILAATIGVWYLLAPYRIATSLDVPLGLAAASIRVLAAHAATGAAIAVTAMSLAWAYRGRHSLVVAGWLVLGCVAVAERLVLPAFVAESAPRERDAQSRVFDQVLHQVHPEEALPSPDSLPAVTRVLDTAILGAWTRARAGRLYGAVPLAGDPAGAWLMAWDPDVHEPGAGAVRVADGALGPGGQPLVLDTLVRLPGGPRTAPGLAGWRAVDRGVRAGGLLRRAALAWALQAPAILRLPRDATIDWHRDPAARVAALMPGVEWSIEGPVIVDGRLQWVVAGLATIGHAPLSTRIAKDGRTVSGVVAALVALVSADDGAVRVYRDPGHHPVGEAWAAVYRAMTAVTDGATLPPGAMGYSRTLFAGQLDVLAQPHWGFGVRPLDGAADSVRAAAPPAEGVRAGEWQAMLEDPGRGRSAVLLVARRRNGLPVIDAIRLPDPAMPTPRDITAAWLRMPRPSQLADSLRAAGDTLLHGPLRWHVGAAGPVAWQGFRGAGVGNPIGVVWVGTAWPAGIGGDRRPESAWRDLGGRDTVGGSAPRVDALGQLDAVRTWLARADSALQRGDLTAFGRAWEALRGLLLQPPGRGPE